MRGAAVLLLAAITLIGGSLRGDAMARRSEGEVLFDFAARFQSAPRLGEPVTIHLMVVDFDGYRADSVAVTASLELPAGWELISGQTTQQKVMKGEFGWAVTVRPVREGTFELKRSLRIDRKQLGIDEGEYLQEIQLRADSTVIGPTRRLRLEATRDGQRYRYGESFLVPIDTPENFTQGDLSERAKVTTHTAAVCVKCSPSDPNTVSWVVFVGPNGKIKGARLASAVDPTSAVVSATRGTLDSWTFSSGKVGDRAVADWVIVHVSVTR